VSSTCSTRIHAPAFADEPVGYAGCSTPSRRCCRLSCKVQNDGNVQRHFRLEPGSCQGLASRGGCALQIDRMTAEVVTMGEAMLRLSSPGGVRVSEARELDLHVGGAESNVAVALARLGVRVSWVSALPRGPLGQRIVDELRSAGVDTTHVARSRSGRVGLYFVERGHSPRPTRVTYDRAGSAFSRGVQWDPTIFEGVGFVVVSGITPALSRACERSWRQFAAEAHASSGRVVMDVNYRARLWTARRARTVLSSVLDAVDIVVVSRRDAATVFGIDGPELTAIAERFADQFAPSADLVVVTAGRDGAVGRTRGGQAAVEAGIPTAPVDRLGAGDAFTAGLVYGLLQNRWPADSLRFACALAALKCTVAGDHSQFSCEEVEDAIAQRHEVMR
jgi:2-dehydro-3-deoxygluconokinase